jgi:hypothetical protein
MLQWPKERTEVSRGLLPMARLMCTVHLTATVRKVDRDMIFGADSDESLEKLLWKEMQKRGISNIGELPPAENQAPQLQARCNRSMKPC